MYDTFVCVCVYVFVAYVLGGGGGCVYDVDGWESLMSELSVLAESCCCCPHGVV